MDRGAAHFVKVVIRWNIMRAPMMALPMLLSPGFVSTMSAAPLAASVAPAQVASWCERRHLKSCGLNVRRASRHQSMHTTATTASAAGLSLGRAPNMAAVQLCMSDLGLARACADRGAPWQCAAHARAQPGPSSNSPAWQVWGAPPTP